MSSIESRLIQSANNEDARLQNIRLAREERLRNSHQKIIEAKLGLRRFSAKEWGRIVLDGKPDFIGNFSFRNPTGIFEMYIEEQEENGKFSGKIEDCFGTALFDGIILSEQVHFTKQYIPEDSSVYASTSKLEYQGFLVPQTGGYCGRYAFIDLRRAGGSFYMNKGCLEKLEHPIFEGF